MYYIKTQQRFIWKFLNKNFPVIPCYSFPWTIIKWSVNSEDVFTSEKQAVPPVTIIQRHFCQVHIRVCNGLTVIANVSPSFWQSSQPPPNDIRYLRIWFWNNFHRYWTIVYCLFSIGWYIVGWCINENVWINLRYSNTRKWVRI